MIRGGWKNSRKHRDRLNIMAEILKIAKGGTLKTPITYKANLNSAQLDEYLSLLLEIGLLKKTNNEEKAIYKTTAKGFHYIKSHEKLTALMSGLTRIRMQTHKRKDTLKILLET